MTTPLPAPLTGVRIVEFEGIGPGPLAAHMLARPKPAMTRSYCWSHCRTELRLAKVVLPRFECPDYGRVGRPSPTNSWTCYNHRL